MYPFLPKKKTSMYPLVSKVKLGHTRFEGIIFVLKNIYFFIRKEQIQTLKS